jgi:hypothetical protein
VGVHDGHDFLPPALSTIRHIEELRMSVENRENESRRIERA